MRQLSEVYSVTQEQGTQNPGVLHNTEFDPEERVKQEDRGSGHCGSRNPEDVSMKVFREERLEFCEGCREVKK